MKISSSQFTNSIIIMSMSSLSIIGVSPHLTPAYSHESHSDSNRSNWMAKLDDRAPLNTLSWPGTHDSEAFYGGDVVHTQTLPLAVQLQAGIRAFDIRCRHINNKFAIHHGSVFQRAWFNNVLDDMVDFLAKFPSESLLVRITKTYLDSNNTRSFTNTFLYYKELDEYDEYFWNPPESAIMLDTTLRDVRGRIVIIDDFSPDELKPELHKRSKFGFDYHTDFEIQDSYILKTNWDLYSKWEKVKAQLISANSAPMSPSPARKMFMNYLSGSTGSFRYFVASGHVSHGSSSHRLSTGFTTPLWKSKWPDFPRIDCVLGVCTICFEGTNVLTWEFIVANEKTTNYVGIIMIDFPGSGLIESIVQLNYKLMADHNWNFWMFNSGIVLFGNEVGLGVLIVIFVLLGFVLYVFGKKRRKPKSQVSVLNNYNSEKICT